MSPPVTFPASPLDQNPAYFASNCGTPTPPNGAAGERRMSGRFQRCEHDRLVSIDVMQDGTIKPRRECSHSPIPKKKRRRSSHSVTPKGVSRASTRSTSIQHPRTARSKAMAKAKAALAEFRAKKDAARRARAAKLAKRNSVVQVQPKKTKTRYETPKAKVVKKPIVAPRVAKKLDFHKQHERNYYDDREWKADLASDDEGIIVDELKKVVGGFRVPIAPPRMRTPTGSGRSTPKKPLPTGRKDSNASVASDDAAARKRRRRLMDGAWSLRRDGEEFSDDDEYDDDLERDAYPDRVRRRVGRDTMGDVWKTSRKRKRRSISKKKKKKTSALGLEHDLKEEELASEVSASSSPEPESDDDPNMVYFAGLMRHPRAPSSYKSERIAVPKELLYHDIEITMPGALDKVADPMSMPIFGIDYMPSETPPMPKIGLPKSGELVKAGKRELAATPTAVPNYTATDLEKMFAAADNDAITDVGANSAKVMTDEADDQKRSSWSPFSWFSSLWGGNSVAKAPESGAPTVFA